MPVTRQLDNWLERYIDFTQNTEPPVLYHLWCGIVAISSCLQRKCYINWAYEQTIYPNLYVVLVGPPGGRKGTAMKIAKRLLRKVDIFIGADSLGSTQALYQEIKSAEQYYIDPIDNLECNHKSLSAWSEEFKVFLSTTDPRFITNITDLFDSPNSWRYSSIGRGVEDLSNCWLTIFGATTPSQLQSGLNLDAVGGGLISRIIFVVGYGKEKKVARSSMSKEKEELSELLYEDLENIKDITGEFTTSKAFDDAYTIWYNSPKAEDGVDNGKFEGYNQRRALHVRKLCMVMCASENNSKHIELHHFHRALDVLEMTEREMQNAFYGIGQGSHANTLAEIAKYIESEKTVPHKELLKRFKQDTLGKDFESLIDTLVQTGEIKRDYDTKKACHITATPDINTGEEKDFLDNELFKHLKKEKQS